VDVRSGKGWSPRQPKRRFANAQNSYLHDVEDDSG
jgi:hypothetical protein